MKTIQPFALLLSLLLMPAFFSGASAAGQKKKKPEPVEQVDVMEAFRKALQNDPFLSDQAQENINGQIEQYLDALLNRTDKEDYMQREDVAGEVAAWRQELQHAKEGSSLTIEKVLEQYQNLDAEERTQYRASMETALSEKFIKLERNLDRLEKEMEVKPTNQLIDWENLDWKLIGTIIGGLLFLIILIVIISKSRKKKDNTPPVSNYSHGGNGPGEGQVSADGNIVVRRKTATILKKQSLEDVIDNPNYMQVDAIDFCYESAVRRMYIKNTCIIDIYNMYAEDLRNPENPKEDGCMVLGRWVHDPESNEYYVSLEEIVLPGDDAVFQEYELNFGGKIKLKVLEQLRKLRRETNLQYDLTCWVHSHPGLGVFFSNSDVSVQMQLKHPTHPNFLTAIVVDILTPMQELGIFTFRRDQNINSKNDLKKMYSLIEWYQWAKDSLGNQPQAAAKSAPAVPREFKNVDYFNTLEHAGEHIDVCNGVQLSKNAVVDMCMALSEQANGLVGKLHGFASQKGAKADYVAELMSEKDEEPKLSLTGCFVVAPHCSIPTVRRAVESYLNRIHFVLVYTPGDGLLTTIPVVDNDLIVEDTFHGEQKLEDLKTWIKKGRQ